MPKYTYYNEVDKNAAEWLRQLMKLNQIPDGEVDETDIQHVDADSIRSFCQHHFFSGIGVWAYALRQAGWPDDRPVATGSCPCQGFSVSGKQRGFEDDRHLWPHMFRIIRELRPETCFGEQVSSKLALQWWDLVAGDLESEGYAATAFDLEAAGCGAPHHRARLFWVANATSDRRAGDRSSGQAKTRQQRSAENGQLSPGSQRPSNGGSLADTDSHEPAIDLARCSGERGSKTGWDSTSEGDGRKPTWWDDAEWHYCRDGKYRPSGHGIHPLAIKPRIPPMADGFTAGMGRGSDPSIDRVNATQEARAMRLKGYGNAIVAPLAQIFIKSVMEEIDEF